MTIPDGPYFYFATKTATRPILCEVSCGYVAECGESDWRPLAQYVGGRFVKLVEQPQAEESAPVDNKAQSATLTGG